MRRLAFAFALCTLSTASFAQLLQPGAGSNAAPHPLADPTMTPGETTLLKLEAQFSADVEAHGGAAFSRWFAEDGIELPNGKAPIVGHAAVSTATQWDPKQYQLTWKADGARMNPGGESGFTWGHYVGRSHDAAGQPIEREGRYITVWKRVQNEWKVALDASAEDAPATDCCTLPQK
ncbi:nuclear transport factor 2 family protein [Granulicella cerasi]|uniref:Nuclear transport factor 2 family protein n=1 Tax=Granulicella cerasi TaxID=741063 RepID=A0ABW1Z7N9_9BACT|nr:nuclear transport factor 2 family protein [Granulicella cerasi]